METENNNNVCPICGKQIFQTKSRILNFIYYNNCRKGGDGYRPYYSPKCGCYHLTSSIPTPEHKLKKAASRYNRLNQKEINNTILKVCGLL